jgi:putative oxidoreductase
MTTLMVGTTDSLIDLAMLVGRLFIGVCFMIHAFGKLGRVGTGNMTGFIAVREDLGMPYAPIQGYLVMLTELLGGLALALGFMTRPSCVLLGGTMIVAGKIGHKAAGYLITNDPPGAEYTINLAAICAVFFLVGPGRFSVDYMVW